MDNVQESKQIKTGIVLSYIALALSNLIPIVYTPIMLSLLGQSEYGLSKIAGSITSFLGLMSFGTGSALSRYLIKANVEKGKEAEENVFGLFLLIFQGIAILTIAVGTVLVLKLNVFYEKSLSDSEFRTIQILIAIMVIRTAIGFALTPYTTIVSSHERFIFLQILNLVLTVASPCIRLIALYLGYKSIGMEIISGIMSLVTSAIYIYYVHKVLCIRPRFNNMPTGVMKEILMFSFWVFVADIVNQLYHSTDTVIIGMIPELATTGVARYSIGTTFSSIVSSLSIVIPGFFSPKANKMVFAGASKDEMTNLVIKTGRIQAAIVMLIASGFIAFGRQFIDFYVGSDYKESYWVAILIMIPNCIPLVQSTALAILQAKNLHRYRAMMYLAIAIANVVFTAILVKKYGIIGAALPTGVALVLGQGIFMNWFYWKKMNLDIPRFWKSLLPFFAISILLCGGTLIVSNWINFYAVWKMIVGIVVYSILYVFLLWRFVLHSDEKNLVFGALNKLHLRGKNHSKRL